MRQFLKIGFGAALALAFVRPASADVIETFTFNNNGGIVSGNDVGTIKLDQINADQVQVTVTLNSAVAKGFVTTGSGQHPTFAFNISGDPSIKVTDLTAGFSYTPGSVPTSGGFGNFDYAVINDTGTGGSHELSGPLVFDVGLTGGGAFQISSFAQNSNNFWFVADILGQNGKTGLVASSGPGIKLPEAPTPLILGAGLLGLIMLRRRKSLLPARAK